MNVQFAAFCKTALVLIASSLSFLQLIMLFSVFLPQLKFSCFHFFLLYAKAYDTLKAFCQFETLQVTSLVLHSKENIAL
jgi:hypothetical protein